MIRRAVVAVAALAALALLGGCGSATGPAASSSGSAPSAPAAVVPGAPACPTLAAAGPAPDDGLPALRLPCLGTGPAVRLSDLRGVPTVVNVWAAWCSECRVEMPYFRAAVRDAGTRVRFLGVHAWAARAFGQQSVRDFGVPFASVDGGDGNEVPAALRVPAPPTTLFVDAGGHVVGRKVGVLSSEQQLRDLIRRYLGVSV